jgi:chemotaxis protein MotB
MSRMNLRRFASTDPDPETDYWMSVGDLMAGLLMVFALLLLTALFHYQSGVEGVREVLEMRQEVVKELQREMAMAQGRIVDVDEEGTVRFRENVLFAQGSAEVTAEGRAQLEVFTDRYLSVLLGKPEFREQLKAIVIEGHTNDDGSYELNLRLSQARAFAVMMVLLEEAGKYRQDLQSLVTANGRSFAQLIRKEDGTVDKAASRRIEIRFQMENEELIRQVLEKVYGTD